MSLFSARPRLTGLALAALVFLADQWLKTLVGGPLGLREQGDHLDLLPFFDLTRTHNFGVSLGFLTASSMEMRWGLVLMTSGIAVVVFVWLLREKKLADIVPLALVLGGALGNIRDRVRLGFVLDYADLHVERYFPFLEFDLLGRHFDLTRPFLIFNLADAAITIGVVIILARSFLIRDKRANEDAGTPATEN